ncbi:MAG: hypothetical protein JWQ64_851, partial [Subtercola sp.]|nr:hypothetical protein [Subtercola sp.]
ALILAVTIPGLGLWSLLALVVGGFFERSWVRRSRAKLAGQPHNT